MTIKHLSLNTFCCINNRELSGPFSLDFLKIHSQSVKMFSSLIKDNLTHLNSHPKLYIVFANKLVSVRSSQLTLC